MIFSNMLAAGYFAFAESNAPNALHHLDCFGGDNHNNWSLKFWLSLQGSDYKYYLQELKLLEQIKALSKGYQLPISLTFSCNTYIHILYLSSKFKVAVELISSRKKKLNWNKNMLYYNFNIIYKLYTTKS